MSSDELIQKSLFGSDSNLINKNNGNFEAKELTNEALTKDSKERPRERKHNNTVTNSSKDGQILSEKEKLIIESSHSIKTVNKEKLPPVLKHYVSLKEENINYFLLYLYLIECVVIKYILYTIISSIVCVSSLISGNINI